MKAMIILDKPFVSDHLKQTILKYKIPVLKTAYSLKLGLNDSTLLSETEAAAMYSEQNDPAIYSNSENAINWVASKLKNTNLPHSISTFKNKIQFRKLIADLYPDFFYKELKFSDIDNLVIENIPTPFVIKPAVGFFSMGVYKVFESADWPQVCTNLKNEIEQCSNLYPEEVMDAKMLIIEQLIEGEEFAFDAYFNSDGEPLILGILKHVFSSDNDVSDRVYYTSDDLFVDYLHDFEEFCKEIGSRLALRNFPMHVEVRINENNKLVPIEINPMRFGGWCTTADLTSLALGINPYKYFFEQKKPDWSAIFRGKATKQFNLIVLDNSTGYNGSQIASFNYKELAKGFSNVIEIRETDWNEYPVFGFVFVETEKHNYAEIEKILKSDLKEFVTLKQ